ncbi:MAG TPA: SPASM domain-containing protein [Candidatus Sulfotelmatobacter sp.]|nr:SPASM domain-containing protein [Candidatus Sulfotelmatobacter sp.]
MYVDLPDDRAHVLLVHGYSGAFDKVPASVASYLRSLDERPPKPLYGDWTDTGNNGDAEATRPSDELLALLTKRGYLTSLTRAEERARFDRLVQMRHEKWSALPPAYTLMPTYDCNLRCGYCFQDHMRTDARYEHLLRFMTPQVVDRIVAAMPAIEERHGLTQPGAPRNVMFFGGEPLLARSRPLIDYLMAAIRRAGPATFTAVSNGTQLDAYEDVLGPEGITVLQITIDGTPELHDTRRVHADGTGSFAAIARNIDLALGRGAKIDVRMNVDRSNVDVLPRLASLFEERGWFRDAGFSAYVAPVHGTKGNLERKTTFNSHELGVTINAMKREHPQLGKFDLPDDDLARNLRSLFREHGDALPQMKAAYCGAHTSMYVIDPFGDIYACWERTGDKNLRVGWIEADGTPQFVADRLATWRKRNVSSNETCGQCRYSMYCGGGCAVLAEDVHGTIFGNYCDAFGRRFRETVGRAYGERHLANTVDERVASLRAL